MNVGHIIPGRTSIELINQAQENTSGAGLTGDKVSQTSTQRAVTPLSIIPSQQTVNNKSHNNDNVPASTQFINE